MSDVTRSMGELHSVGRAGNTIACAEPVRGRTRQVEGLRSETQFNGLSLVIDEPCEFGGTGTASNPAAAALPALGASLKVTRRCYTEMFGLDAL